jgi:hypothetical protein
MGLWRDYSVEDEALMMRNEDEQDRKTSVKPLMLGTKTDDERGEPLVVDRRRSASDSNLSLNCGTVIVDPNEQSASTTQEEITAGAPDQLVRVANVDDEIDDDEEYRANEGNMIVASGENRELLVDDYAGLSDNEDEDTEAEIDLDGNLSDYGDEVVGHSGGFKDKAKLGWEQLRR